MSTSSSATAGATSPTTTDQIQIMLRRHIQRAAILLRIQDLATWLFLWLSALIAIWLTASLVEHWLVAMSIPARWGVWAVWICATVWLTTRYVAPLLVRRINPDYVAQRIEMAEPELKTGLVSWLQLESMPNNGVPRGIMAGLARHAARYIHAEDPSSSLDTRNLIKSVAVMTILLAALAVYGMFSPKSVWDTGKRLAMPWSSIAPPARVQLVALEPGDSLVTQGKPLKLDVKLRGLRSGEAVVVKYSTLDGQLVDQHKPLDPAEAGFHYTGTLSTAQASGTNGRGIQHELDYWIEAGDLVSGPYRITLSRAPAVNLESVTVDFPKYTKLPRRMLTGGAIEAVEGSSVLITATSNQPMQKGQIEIDPELDGNGELLRAKAALAMQVNGQSLNGKWLLKVNEARDNPTIARYRIRGFNARGDANDDPIEYQAKILADVAPEVSIPGPEDRRMRMLVNGQMNVEVRAIDPDFGLEEVSVQVKRKDELLKQAVVLRGDGVLGRQVKLWRFRPSDFQANVGDQFVISAVAIDNRHDPVSGEPAANKTTSDPLTIEIVEPTKLAETDAAHQPPANPPEADPELEPNKKSDQSSSTSDNASSSGDNSSSTGDSSQNSSSGQDSKGDSSSAEKQAPNQSSTGAEASQDSPEPNDSKGSNDSTQSQDSKSSADSKSQPSQNSKGQNSKGQNSKGQDSKGQDSKGQDSKGQEAKGQESKGQSSQPDASSASSSSSGGGESGQDSKQSQSKGGSGQGDSKSGNSKSSSSGQGKGNSGNSSRSKPKHDGEVMERVKEFAEKQASQASSSNGKATDSKSQGSDSKSDRSNGSDSKSNSSDNKSQGSDSKSGSSDSKSQASDPKSQSSNSKSDQPNGSDSKSNSGDKKSQGSDSKSGNSDSKSQASDPKSQGSNSKSDQPNGSDSKSNSGDNKSQGSDSKSESSDSKSQASDPKSQGSNSKSDQSNGSDSKSNSSDNKSQGSDSKSGSSDSKSQASDPKSQGSNSKSDQSNGSDSKSNSGDNKSQGSDSKSGNSGSKPQASDPKSQGSNSKSDQSNGSDSKSNSGDSKSQGSDSKSGSSDSKSQASDPKSQGSNSKSDQSNSSDTKSNSGDSKSQGSDSKSGSSDSKSQSSNSKSDQSNGGDSKSDSGDSKSQGSDSKSQGSESGSDSKSGGSQAGGDKGKPGGQSDPSASGQAGGDSGQGGTPGSNSAPTASQPKQLNPNAVPNSSAAANEEYANKVTNLVLDYLSQQKDQPDPELLRELNWTKEDLDAFLKRWQAAKNLASSPDPEQQRKWNDELRALGLLPPNQTGRAAAGQDNKLNGLRDSGSRMRAPESLRRQYDAFRRAVQDSDK